MFAPSVLRKILLILCFLLVVWQGPLATQKALISPKAPRPSLRVLKNKRKIRRYDSFYLGKASWYGSRFHGRLTANGEIYNMHSLTAAHKSLPFDTFVKVTNLNNQETVVVRINDRGPYIAGRDIDLSYRAAQYLNMVGQGVAQVKIEVLKAQSRFVYRGPKLGLK